LRFGRKKLLDHARIATDNGLASPTAHGTQ
jgi:hypothetical protein